MASRVEGAVLVARAVGQRWAGHQGGGDQAAEKGAVQAHGVALCAPITGKALNIL